MVQLLIISVLSNVVGNNLAVMLLIPHLGGTSDHAAVGAALALGTGFSSNMLVFGSLAGIIVVEQAKGRSANSPAPATRLRAILVAAQRIAFKSALTDFRNPAHAALDFDPRAAPGPPEVAREN